MLPSMGADHGEPFSPTKIHPLLSPQRESFSASGVKSAVDTRLLNLNDAHHPRSSSPSATFPSQPTPTPTPTPSSTPINNEHSQAHLSPSPNVDHQSLSIVTTEDANSVVTHDVSGTAPASGLPADPPPNGPIRTDTQLTSSSKSSSIENLTLLPPKASFRENRNRKHRKGAHSIDSIPRQTILKALQSRPNGSRKMSVSNSMDAVVMDSENSKAVAPKTTASGSFAHARLAEALSELDLDSSEMTVSKMAALASPCFYHKKFDKAVNLEKVLDEMAEDDTISHSRLMQTATSVREIAKQLQRRPIKMAVRNIMIVTKARDNELVHLTRQLAEWLLCTPRYGSDVGVNVYVDHKLRKSKRFDMPSLLAKDERFHDMLRFWTPELCWTSPEKFDLVLTLGGDGTVLFTSWLFQRIVPPILSFSLGSLGFLTNFEFAQHQNALNKIMGDAGMRVNLRMRFTCTVYRYQKHAAPGAPQHIEAEQFEVLNELVIDRGPSPYVSQLELYGDNNLLTVVQADGCIFSTPTGSTAYSLSAGGSLVHPDIPAILLTPICPHTLSFRPMLLNDSMLLRVAVPRNSRATAYCAFDGKGRVELRQGDHVTIAASQYPFPTVLSQPTEWFDSLSRTLRWNNRGAQQKAWDGDEKEDEDGTTKDTGFDIDFDNDEADRDSGYSAEGSITGDRESPIRKGIVLPFP